MKRAMFLGIVLACVISPAWPQGVPERIHFQGRLTDASSQPVNSTVSMTFRLYTAATGGAAIWTETQSVAVVGGLYNVQLGEISPISGLSFNEAYWLSIQVAADAEMTPRYKLAATPYALRSRSANGLEGLTATTTEINRLSGIGTGVTAANLTTLTGASNADALHVHDWTAVTNKPTAFPPAAHLHSTVDIAGFDVAAVAAMGAKANSNPLHHDRYTDAEAAAVAAVNHYTKAQVDAAFATKTEVSALVTDKLSLSGGTMTGALNMGFNTLTEPRIGSSTAAAGAATAGALRWVDAAKELQVSTGTQWVSLAALGAFAAPSGRALTGFTASSGQLTPTVASFAQKFTTAAAVANGNTISVDVGTTDVTATVWKDDGTGTWDNVTGQASFLMRVTSAGLVVVMNASGSTQTLKLVVVK
jgi:hypothetical protein